ncbi:unnamed protein product [Cylindrotheca closterium]|uniref:Uncharacterized protein n=1 Tax=Cylindrotheca closterium TaxID=2856 RepID=A0AAD2PV76_9STRA|nr:unnamed protein product [Cylindrotheca closterium]
MDNLRLSHVVLSDMNVNANVNANADDTLNNLPKDDKQNNKPSQHRSAFSFLVTAGKEEPHTSSSFQLYSLVVALVTLFLGPPSAKSALAAASYFLLGSKQYASILSGVLRMITFSSAAVRLELGLIAKVPLPSLVDRSQLLLCLDSLGLVMTIVTTWMMPQFILAWAAIRGQVDAHAIIMTMESSSSSSAALSLSSSDSSLAMLAITCFLSVLSIILEGYILRYTVHTQQSIEKAELLLTE